MPRVSIVLPTYNRADVLPRALRSIARQGYTDWELIVVDDGSTDSTEAVIRDSGLPFRYLRAQHGGVSAARNIGIRAGQSEFVAFLDSDDEWDPCFLSVCAGFLERNPKEQMVATEVLQDFGGGRRRRELLLRLNEWYPKLARRIGSHALDLPAGETDPYMRVFSDRIDVTDWFTEVSGEPRGGQVYRYHGNVFPYFRWGYLFSVSETVVRRAAIDEAGLFDESLSSGEDLLFLGEICRRYSANLIAWPGFVKHEFDQKGRYIQEGHLATSRQRVIQFYINLLRVFDTLYDSKESADNELRRLRGYGLFTLGREALNQRDVQLARRYLEESLLFFPEHKAARAVLLLTKIMPAVAARLYGPAARVLSIGERIVRGNFSTESLVRRLFQSK